MHSQWSESEAAGYQGLLAQRVYSSRLLGRDHALVLHGGGNTSVKIRELNVFGDEEDILYVKGSGWDLETIEAAGFAPLRLEHVRRLATLDRLSDPRMVQELRAAMTDPAAPTPSVETILHAILPYRFVDHTHADALLAITNTVDGQQRVRDIYGGSVVIIPYVMPGFDLARAATERFSDESGPKYARNGAAQAWPLLVRGDGAGGVRADDRASYARRGVPRGMSRVGRVVAGGLR